MIKFMQNEIAVGRLQFLVYDKGIASPIRGAAIEIIESSSSIAAKNITTDISGKSDIIDLNAPSLSYSEAPGENRPYSLYDAVIEAEGYESVRINGIQILPGATALQNVYMNPNSPTSQESQIDIPPSGLFGDYPEKLPEAEEKEENPETGFIVLDEVVIPEYIVVHDGIPEDASAPNYYIPFKDYIKNVASSEIYATWPDAAIRANVLAIISFTLNRVYTEWYRNMGKNFTITNSTAYDHYFVYGRNIYEKISVIVDEMFTTYVKRYGSRQPLLTQYCDGESVSCPGWLSQWGSKYLADQGYNAVEILRYYYGDDIYLDTARKVSGIPSSYPGNDLQNGSFGEEVRTVQRQLNSISRNYPAIPKVTVDGIYGSATTRAVQTFQGIFNLPQSGIVDFPTWYQLSQVYVAVERIAEL